MADENQQDSKAREGFISRVSKYGSGGRKHIEVPKKHRREFESGTYVSVRPIRK